MRLLEVVGGIPGWYRHGPFYEWAVNEAPDGAHFVEVGVLFGSASNGLARLILESGKQVRLTMVDAFDVKNLGPKALKVIMDVGLGGFRDTFDHFRRGAAHDSGFCDVVTGDTVSSSSIFSDGSLDLVFLDTRHDEEHVSAEISAWLPKVKPAGVLAIKAGGVRDGEYTDHPGARAALAKACASLDRAVVVFDEFASYVRR